MKNVALSLALASVGIAAPHGSSSSAAAPAPTGASYDSGFDMTKSWANLSPYKNAESFGVPKGVPQGCELSQVHVLHRHAERFPTSNPLDGKGMGEFASKLKKHSSKNAASGPLKFLNDWEYVVGENTLMENGAATEDTSGANFWIKYGRLLYRADRDTVAAWNETLNVYENGTARPKPVFRTTSQGRIFESAKWWLSGFFGNSSAHNSEEHYDLIVIPEGDGLFNNTLAPYDACPGDKKAGDRSAEPFIENYTKNAVKRLSSYLPTGFNLTAYDVLAMQNLCVYEHTSLGGSSFCSLFTEQEWKDFAYNIDLQYYGNFAFGSPTGRAQGIGYVLELAARLEGKLIHSSDTSVNYTYDNNEKMFPLNQPFYMDMSHDDNLLSVITALGLEQFNHGPKGLPNEVDHAPSNRNFTLNDLTPFGARFMSEVWTCPSNVSFQSLDPILYVNPRLQKKDTKKFIRFALNDAPLPLDGLVGCKEAKNGFCPLEGFLGGVQQLKKNAEYQYACFGEYPDGPQVGDGVPESS